ncbi:MAG: isopentenyl-diphosphate delta-isomerase [Prolixibacteraceae bacterium]
MNKDRKLEHIQMASDSQTISSMQDQRFIYEPLLASHPTEKDVLFYFLEKSWKAPFWVSSMTGGTGISKTVNHNIARVCRELGLGMGLGSCRKILFDKTHWTDFDVRDELGPDRPFWANLGIAQVAHLLKDRNEKVIIDLVKELRADGLIIHVNPLQEWFQPEGDRIEQPPLETIQDFMVRVDLPLIVKEVGQGMGNESLKELLRLPLAAIEFAAFGGTNFSKLELLRDTPQIMELYQPFIRVGQTAGQMVKAVNRLVAETEPVCRQIIISGGVKNYLDGYYLVSLCRMPAVFGMASSVLKYATGDYDTLKQYMENQIKAYRLAQAYLRLNPDYEGE